MSARRIAGGISGVLLIVLLYLFFWPVPIAPVAWNAPEHAGLIDPFESNDRLASARLIDLGEHEGPEDIAGGPDGRIYTATSDGLVLRSDSNGNGVEVFADAGGRPLGLEFDSAGNLLVANAYQGLQRIAPTGRAISSRARLDNSSRTGGSSGLPCNAAISVSGTFFSRSE